MSAVHTAIDAVRRGGTVSLIGVSGGQSDPMPILTMFDKQLQLRRHPPVALADAPQAYEDSRRSRTARSRWSSSREPGSGFC